MASPLARHIQRWQVGALIALLLIALSPAFAAQAAQAVFQDTLAQRVQVCFACHGEQGRAGPDGYYPRIAGKPAGYLYNQLRHFQTGKRRHNLMTRLTANLSDAYLMEMAQYFSALDLPYAAPPAPRVAATALARGRQLALQGDTLLQVPACSTCHGEQLTGRLPATPGLLGLSSDYLSAQLGAWQTGARAAHAPDCMAQVVQRLQPGDLAAVSSWLAAQPVPPRASAAPPALAPPLTCGAHQRPSAAQAAQTEAKPVPVSGGRYLAVLGNCQGCHTRPGAPPFSGGLGIPTPFGTVYSSNLTPAASGLATWNADDFWRAMHHGQSRDGRWLNPAFPYTNFRHITRADSDALYAFFKGLEPVEAVPPPHALRWPFNTQLALRVWRRLYLPTAEPKPQPAAQGAADAQRQRGAYLVQGLGHCSACHMPRNALGGNADMLSLDGGFIAGQSWYAPSLRDPLDGGVQNRPAVEVRQLLQSGRGGADRTSGPMAEVVRHSLQQWTVQDIDAMVAYLQSLPKAAAAEPTVSPAPPRRVLDSGAALYEKHCADCHGAQGQGVRGADGNWAYPPLRGNRTVLQNPPVNLLQTVLYGGFGPSTAGHPRPFGMPPYVLTLSEQELADLMTFIRAAWGHQAAPVSALDVQRLRNGAAR